jgi:hypothetical protein
VRNKVTIGVGLVAVMLAIVGPPFVALSVRPYEPPLSVGMTPKEVHEIIGLPTIFFGSTLGVSPGEHYYIGPDCFGNDLLVIVHFETDDQSSSPDDRKVVSWEVKRLFRTRPPWMDAALKWIGW